LQSAARLRAGVGAITSSSRLTRPRRTTPESRAASSGRARAKSHTAAASSAVMSNLHSAPRSGDQARPWKIDYSDAQSPQPSSTAPGLPQFSVSDMRKKTMNALLRSKFLIAASLAAIACGNGSDAEQAGVSVVEQALSSTTTPCNGSTVCIQSTLVCIDPATAVCDTQLAAPAGYTGYCAFRLKVSSSCGCVESTVRHCSLPAGGAGGAPIGIQDCAVAGGPTANWGGCHS
jgi:hypothetical protein